MRKFAFLVLIVLEGCAAISNPVQSTQVFELENAYGVAQGAAIGYVKLPRCQLGTVPPCAKDSTVVALGEADKRARIALNAVEDFSRSPQNFPTLQFGDLFRVAQEAIGVFSQLANGKGN